MKRIGVLGNSIAGVKAIEEIRKRDPESKATLFTLDGSLPYFRHLLAGLVSKDISRDQIYYRAKEYYQQLGVDISDEKIHRINCKRRRVTTEDKNQADYDLLIIADTGTDKLPDIKGTHRAGIFSLRRLSEIEKLITALPLTETVVIQGGGKAGFEMARALQKRGKEAIWVVPQTAGLSSEEMNIRVIEENTIAELLGDNDIKAVKLKSGKVIAAEAVIFGDMEADLRLLKDSGLQIQDRISVDAHFKTNMENVFALNGVCDPGRGQDIEDADAYLSVLEGQGKAVAAYLERIENPDVSLSV